MSSSKSVFWCYQYKCFKNVITDEYRDKLKTYFLLAGEPKNDFNLLLFGLAVWLTLHAAVFWSSACLHIHILPLPTCIHAEHVEKNAAPTPKQPKKNPQNPKQNPKTKQASGSLQTITPTQRKKRTYNKKGSAKKVAQAHAILSVCHRRGNGCSRL